MPVTLKSKKPCKPEEPGSRTAAALPEAPKAEPVDAACCPICSVALHEKREELGALTLNGKRVEATLYHASCITLMLAHRGSMLNANSNSDPSKTAVPEFQPDGIAISWGLSPVSRKPIDGFLRMPPLTDQPKWVEFVDWQGTGKVSVEALSVVIAALLPIDESSAEQYVKRRFRVGHGDIVPEDELVLRVFPHLESRCGESFYGARQLLFDTTPFMRARDALKQLSGTSDLYSLRQVSRSWRRAATCLFLMELEPLLSTSKHVDARNLLTVMHAIEENTCKDDTRAVTAFVRLLHSEEEKVRSLALEALPRMTQKGNRHTLAEIGKLIRHEAASARLVALNALDMCAMKGEPRTIKILLTTLRCDQDAPVRARAIHVLGGIAHKGDAVSIEAVARGLEDQEVSVKRAAENVLPVLAKGDRNAIESFSAELSQSDWKIRYKAMKALGHIAGKGDKYVIQSLTKCYNDMKPAASGGLETDQRYLLSVMEAKAASGNVSLLRRTALFAMSTIADENDKGVWNLMLKTVHDDDCDVAEAAICAFRRIARKGDRRVISGLTVLFEDTRRGPYACLRIHIIDTLVILAEQGDRHFFKAIASRLKDGDPAVREHSARSLVKISHPNDSGAKSTLQTALESESSGVVKLAIKQSLQELAKKRSNDAAISRPMPRCGIFGCLRRSRADVSAEVEPSETLDMRL